MQNEALIYVIHLWLVMLLSESSTVDFKLRENVMPSEKDVSSSVHQKIIINEKIKHWSLFSTWQIPSKWMKWALKEFRGKEKKKMHRRIIIRGKKASNVGSASLDFSLHHVMQSAFLIPLSPPGQFSAMLALSFQGIAYVNMVDKILSAIKQLMCLKFTVVVVVYCV